MISYLFLSEGTSDQSIIPLINKIILNNYNVTINTIIPNFNSVRPRPSGLTLKIKAVQKLYESIDFLVIHRDADSVGRDHRMNEIKSAIASVSPSFDFVAMIPVRMTEAWLLVDQAAIIHAMERPTYNKKIIFPPIKKIEKLAYPKNLLLQIVQEIADLPKRRKNELNFPRIRKNIGEHISNYTILKILPAFALFEADLLSVLDKVNNKDN